MFHASNILLQSNKLDKNSVINKFNDLVNNVLGQLNTEHLNRLIDSATKYIPANARPDLIDGIVSGRCRSLDFRPLTTNSKFKEQRVKNLTINEQFYLLAHLDLERIYPKIGKLNPDFIRTLQIVIRDYFTDAESDMNFE
ncbi:MAG: hypothetical protein K0R49_74 [Burkholderiales bacterium]|jgi:hypothetical protein|nr:hypothetical protein [Burkholderiales bacterium]